MKNIPLPDDIALKLENLQLKEELLKLQIKMLQKQMQEIYESKDIYIKEIKEKLSLPKEFEINLSSKMVIIKETDSRED